MNAWNLIRRLLSRIRVNSSEAEEQNWWLQAETMPRFDAMETPSREAR